MEEANPTSAPPRDSTKAAPPMPTTSIIAQDHKINCIITEITESDKDEEDMPLYLLKRKMCYKHLAYKSTHSQ
ncbi:hypothetical protein J1N35_014144 [Gossypium stocksii]|uniref:Uncharacterized protein n=1 Tax=Gossypium stocksii TaxID=47602 RepID=A0A9D3VUX0_9ROSI|nr:hypothetical protein J1N35_014144 [Gossypium stocksii]